MATIVVGVDGSDCSQRALEWGAKEASVHGYELYVLTAFDPPDTVGMPGARYSIEPIEETEERVREQQHRWLTDVLDSAHDFKVTAVTRMGGPAEHLLDAAQDATVLVVGSRGRGGVKGLVLGSVSMECVTNAECPVTVIP